MCGFASAKQCSARVLIASKSAVVCSYSCGKADKATVVNEGGCGDDDDDDDDRGTANLVQTRQTGIMSLLPLAPPSPPPLSPPAASSKDSTNHAKHRKGSVRRLVAWVHSVRLMSRRTTGTHLPSTLRLLETREASTQPRAPNSAAFPQTQNPKP